MLLFAFAPKLEYELASTAKRNICQVNRYSRERGNLVEREEDSQCKKLREKKIKRKEI